MKKAHAHVARSEQNRYEHLDFLGKMASHNLRSPMAGMRMIFSLMDSVENPEQKVEMLEHLKEGSDVLFEMIEDLSQLLLDYSETVKPFETIHLKECFEKVLSTIEQQGNISKINLSTDLENPGSIQYSSYFIEAILTELISNAIESKRTDAPLEIMVQSCIEGGWVSIKIMDNGIGIDPSIPHEQLFKMYKSYKSEPDREHKGNGLFRVKNMVEILGGKVHLESKNNQGTTVTVQLYQL